MINSNIPYTDMFKERNHHSWIGLFATNGLMFSAICFCFTFWLDNLYLIPVYKGHIVFPIDMQLVCRQLASIRMAKEVHLKDKSNHRPDLMRAAMGHRAVVSQCLWRRKRLEHWIFAEFTGSAFEFFNFHAKINFT